MEEIQQDNNYLTNGKDTTRQLIIKIGLRLLIIGFCSTFGGKKM